MRKLYLSYITTSEGGEPESDELYASRSDEYRQTTFLGVSREPSSFFAHDLEVSDSVYNSDEVHLVIVFYTDGDTFGTTHGYFNVWAVVADKEEAAKIVKDLERSPYSTDGPFRPWDGYFASIDGIQVMTFGVIGERKAKT